MGDRVYATFRISGLIPSAAAIDAISAAMVEDGLASDLSEAASFFMDGTHNAAEGLGLEDEQANYGEFPALIEACKAHGVAFHHYWSAGQEFGEGMRAFSPKHGTDEHGGSPDESFISLRELSAAAAKGHDAIAALIASAERAAGKGQEPLLLADEAFERVQFVLAGDSED